MTLTSMLTLVLALVVGGTGVAVAEPEHDPATRSADMAEMGIYPEEDAKSYRHYDIPLSDEFQEYVQDVCEQYGLDATVIYGMAEQETYFNPALTGDSGKAQGLLQVQPQWHSARMARLGVTNLYDARQNALVAADYLAELLNTYGNYRDALTAYRYGSLVVTGEDYAGIVLGNAAKYQERR